MSDEISDERLAELLRLRGAGSLLPEDVLGLLARLEREERWRDYYQGRAERRDQRIAELQAKLSEWTIEAGRAEAYRERIAELKRAGFGGWLADAMKERVERHEEVSDE